MTTLLKETLQKGVSIVNRFVSLKPSIPVLANIYLSGEKAKLVLRVTNLETSIHVEIPAKTQTNWETTAPAKLLAEFLTAVGGSEAELGLDKENITIKTQDSQGTLATIAASEFPRPPFVESRQGATEFKAADIYQIVTKIAFAASQDEGKPVLNSIFLTNEEEKPVLVATDGYRLAKYTLAQNEKFDDLLVPARTFLEALKVANDLEEEVVAVLSNPEANQLLVIGDKFQVATRLINGTYPNYKQIIPTDFGTRLEAKREELIAAVKATAVFARDLGNVITLNVSPKQKLTLSATTKQVGEGITSLAANVEGGELVVSFNSHYLVDGLAALKSDAVKIEFSGALSPAKISAKEEPNFVYIVMPVKAQK